MNVYSIIGKNFGDEGKGLATDYFARKAQRQGVPCLGIRHNGGAQAGHTVDLPHTRFIFHQLSSGSFRGADTVWSDTFLPDLYKLHEETESFEAVSGLSPRIYAYPSCRCVWIDDVLINMALEQSRGKARHGSCGMGINEAVVRSKTAHTALALSTVVGASCESLTAQLRRLRREYSYARLQGLGLTLSECGEYGELLCNDTVVESVAEAFCRAVQKITLMDDAFLSRFDGDVVMEGAQGLLLDEEYTAYAPHLTTSRTGLTNPVSLCRRCFGATSLQAVYVSRTYVTRHGAGPLPSEDPTLAATYGIHDATNEPNRWQGALRFAPHESIEAFCRPVEEDLGSLEQTVSVVVLLTHANETNDLVLMNDHTLSVNELARALKTRLSAKVYISRSPYAEDIMYLS